MSSTWQEVSKAYQLPAVQAIVRGALDAMANDEGQKAMEQGMLDALEERALRRDVYGDKDDYWWDYYLVGFNEMMKEMYGE